MRSLSHAATRFFPLHLVAALLAFGAPSAALAQTCTKQFQLVGFSSQNLNGNAGVFRMTAACQQDFEASRVCTSEEVMNTVEIPELSAQNAWVRPALRPIGGGSIAVLADASGSDSADGNVNSLPGDLTCRGWTRTSNYNGLTVNSDGGFLPQSCSGSRPVACCSLIRVPEPPLAAIQGGAMAALASLARVKKAKPQRSCEEGGPSAEPDLPGDDAADAAGEALAS
jgi:hypothetical protein